MQKQVISSDDDGESSKKLSYFTGTSGQGRELNRSESVSTTESDTFDLIPSRKKNLPEVCVFDIFQHFFYCCEAYCYRRFSI